MRFKIYFIVAIIAFSFFSCASGSSKKETTTSSVKAVKTNKQLNITILLDLSDRIEPTKYPTNPEHFERDIEIVNYFTELFKQDMEIKGAFNAKGKLKVIFSPRPKDGEINQIASELSIDLSRAKNTKEKKEIFDNVSSKFKENLEKIYSKTIETKKYLGSDTWRFFKNDVLDYCIEEDENYRNILVLITDGYIYHIDSKSLKDQRSQFLTPAFIYSQKNNLIGDFNVVKERIEKYDYGYMTTRSDLNNLDILVLEINPTPNRKNDEDVIKEYFRKWFTEMNVNSFELYNSDLPEYTKKRIERFVVE